MIIAENHNTGKSKPVLLADFLTTLEAATPRHCWAGHANSLMHSVTICLGLRYRLVRPSDLELNALRSYIEANEPQRTELEVLTT